MGKDSKKGKDKKRKRKDVDYKEDSDSDKEYDLGDHVEIVDFKDIIKDLFGDKTLHLEMEEEEEDELSQSKQFLENISRRKRIKLMEMEKKILEKDKTDIPLKYKILESELDDKVKKQILEKINFFNSLQPFSSEYQKLRKYIEALEKIPFCKYSNLEVNSKSKPEKIKKFIQNLKSDLKECTYGQEETKNSIIEVVAKWITNPQSSGNILGLCGPPGIGKTSLIKNGLSKALKMPFSFIGLGGATCSSFLQGHEYTYEGAKWGRIVEILVETNCMNPVIFFDELDKISETKAGEEIAGVLTHLTDPSQNNSFSDKYFSGIDFDLSKCFLIFSFNDITKINPILRDRLKIINLKGFKLEEKVNIAKDFSIKKICKNIGFEEKNIYFEESALKDIAMNYCPEEGVRTFEKCLETIIMKINLYNITLDSKDLHLKKEIKLEKPYKITSEVADILLDKIFHKKGDISHLMTMYT